ncbi:MAG: DNA primase DnaG [archaeon]
MGKTYLETVKYMVVSNFEVLGLVEKPDVIGAIFGQSEGLLGSNLDIKELQKNGKIGRIDIEASHLGNKTIGQLKLPCSLSMVETAIIGASIESIEKVGPCDSVFTILQIEDTRGLKRQHIKSRAIELLGKLMQEEIPDTKELMDDVLEAFKTKEIILYGIDKLPAGPSVETSKELIVVEGRADVLTLLRYGFTNVISTGGARIPKSLADIAKQKIVTLFLDGDRGADIQQSQLMKNIKVDFIARAPDGKEVEELTQKEINQSLRRKIKASYVGIAVDGTAAFNGATEELRRESIVKSSKFSATQEHRANKPQMFNNRFNKQEQPSSQNSNFNTNQNSSFNSTPNNNFNSVANSNTSSNSSNSFNRQQSNNYGSDRKEDLFLNMLSQIPNVERVDAERNNNRMERDNRPERDNRFERNDRQPRNDRNDRNDRFDRNDRNYRNDRDNRQRNDFTENKFSENKFGENKFVENKFNENKFNNSVASSPPLNNQIDNKVNDKPSFKQFNEIAGGNKNNALNTLIQGAMEKLTAVSNNSVAVSAIKKEDNKLNLDISTADIVEKIIAGKDISKDNAPLKEVKDFKPPISASLVTTPNALNLGQNLDKPKDSKETKQQPKEIKEMPKEIPKVVKKEIILPKLTNDLKAEFVKIISDIKDKDEARLLNEKLRRMGSSKNSDLVSKISDYKHNIYAIVTNREIDNQLIEVSKKKEVKFLISKSSKVIKDPEINLVLFKDLE